MKIGRKVERKETVKLSCGIWHMAFSKDNTHSIAMWIIQGTARTDFSITIDSMNDLKLLVDKFFKEIESEEQ